MGSRILLYGQRLVKLERTANPDAWPELQRLSLKRKTRAEREHCREDALFTSWSLSAISFLTSLRRSMTCASGSRSDHRW